MKNRPTVGDRIVERLKDFTEQLEGSPETLCAKFTARKVKVDLCPQSYGAEEVKAIRLKLGVSQPVFARILAVSTNSVRGWEQGIAKPPKVACRLMDQISDDPVTWVKWLLKKSKSGNRHKV